MHVLLLKTVAFFYVYVYINVWIYEQRFPYEPRTCLCPKFPARSAVIIQVSWSQKAYETPCTVLKERVVQSLNLKSVNAFHAGVPIFYDNNCNIFFPRKNGFQTGIVYFLLDYNQSIYPWICDWGDRYIIITNPISIEGHDRVSPKNRSKLLKAVVTHKDGLVVFNCKASLNGMSVRACPLKHLAHWASFAYVKIMFCFNIKKYSAWSLLFRVLFHVWYHGWIKSCA